MKGAKLFALVVSLGLLTALGDAQARKPDRDESLRSVAERELALTEAANAIARGQAALERERESIDWAGELLARRGRESLRKLDIYRGHRVERETMGQVRARKLYKLARGGGLLELMFEDGSDGRLTPQQRVVRGRSVRRLVDHDLELLRVHGEAEKKARDELLAATRELSVLAALDSVSRLQAEALDLTRAQVDPALRAAHRRRGTLQRRLGSQAKREDRQLLAEIGRERRDLVRHRGLDLLDPHTLVRPVPGRVVGRFGAYEDRLLDVPMHRNGVEFAAKPNDRVRAIGPGEVVLVGALPGFERVVVIDHGGGYLSLTARLLTITVSEGEEVEAGTVLGRVGPKAVPDGLGTTAYVEVRHGQRPIDPAPYLGSRRHRR
ncbi:Murein hydrolase activator EnvC precursor [Enhygromyxa salina]|uniref:Murein hydrolase activator EnvC n=1 Tax=Enhygromyxa salina TaxID=215803 RepID=A0A2S9YDC0_9BACT|nr:peptidoglycan DD-metalloendopeptidase family protein [Enhygromyxa salina]PRQ03016.1 Murein hydrolase activator EnvC precursor [Enhygromyxa salina]